MITIEEDRCVGCGICARICHEECIALVNGIASVNHELCSTCTQCIAVCPQQALSWDNVPPVAYDESRLPSPEQVEELFKERRTIRFFREDKIDRKTLEEIVGLGIHAPTNNYELRAIVVDGRATIEELDRIILRFVSRIYNLFFRSRTVFSILRRITPIAEPKDRVKIESTLEKGSTYDTPPAAIVFLVGDKRIALSEASAQYALYNMILSRRRGG